MKTNYFFGVFAAIGLLFIGTMPSSAVDYFISFTGSGASTTVESVEVQNLTQGTSVVLEAGAILHLVDWSVGLDQISMIREGMQVFSSPSNEKTSVSFNAKQTGITKINVFGIDGRKIAETSRNLQAGINSFELSLPIGVYLINVKGVGFEYAAKMIGQANSKGNSDIVYTSHESLEVSSALKSASEIGTYFNFVPGDTLLYKGISGNDATIVVDIPVADKTIDFEFVECKDASGNYYPVVKIGEQIWMAENLRTEKYQSGANIPKEENPAVWGAEEMATGAWVSLNYDVANDLIFGKLYNWFAVSDVRGLAPEGWHVPSIPEFEVLQTLLGGEDLAGGALKERGDTYWDREGNKGTNFSGFSARAGAKCNSSGVMNDFNYFYMWTTTESTETPGEIYCAYGKGHDSSFKLTYDTGGRNGFSVRCIKD